MFVLGVDTQRNREKNVGECDKRETLKPRMGVLLSRLAPAESGREDGARAEPYNMLLETDATLRRQRALKRELCVTRAAVLVLVLLLVLSLCGMFFMQFIRKDRGYNTKANDDQQVQAQVADVDIEPKGLRSISLKVDCSVTSQHREGNITWTKKHDLDNVFWKNFESLVVPKDGMYRIALQVTYRNTKPEPDQVLLSHEVRVYLKGAMYQHNTFLEVHEYVYWKNSMWKKSKYSEDVFLLQQGDIITVKSNNLNFIDCDGNVGAKTFLRISYEHTC